MNSSLMVGAAGLVAILVTGAGCGADGDVALTALRSATAAGPASKAVRTAAADGEAFVDACSSSRKYALIVDAIGPSTHAEAHDYAHSPREAARRLQTSRAFGRKLSGGALVRMAAASGRSAFGVFEGEVQVGRIDVRPLGYGAFGVVRVDLCR